LPSVNALHRELRGQGLEVLLIDFRESPDRVRRVVKERGYTAPVLLDESGQELFEPAPLGFGAAVGLTCQPQEGVDDPLHALHRACDAADEAPCPVVVRPDGVVE